MPPYIRIRGLIHTYAARGQAPVPALRGVDLDVKAGEYLAMLGANGSGKTTLALHLNGILLPTAGEVTVGGRSPMLREELLRIRSEVGMVFQSPADQMVGTTVEEDVAFAPENFGLPRAEIAARVREALLEVGMYEHRSRPPLLLSAGQQQKVAIAGAIAMRPRCLVLDEATAMLDPASERAVLDIIRGLHHGGMTILTVTHRMEEALPADRLIVLHAGRIVAQGTPREVFSATISARSGWGFPQSRDSAGC